MNNTFLFMNWVLDRLDNSDSNDFQAFVLYMRNSLTPQLWEDFMKSDSALSLTQSFVDSVKQKVVPKPKKSRAKKAESTLEESNTLSNEEDGVLREPEQVAPKPKKSRAKKVVEVTPILNEDGVSNTTQEESNTLSNEEDGVLREPEQVAPKPKKSRAKKVETNTLSNQEDGVSNTTQEESNTLSNQEDVVLRETEPVAPKPKKSRAKKVESNTLSNEGVVPVKNTKKSGSRVLKKSKEELSEVVGLNEEEEYQEIQLQLVNVGGRDAFIDSQNNIVF